MVKNRTARRIMLAAAALLVCGAIALSFFINRDSELERLSAMLAGYGYSVGYDDIYPASAGDGESLAELTGVTREDEAYAVSEAGGFPCNIDTAGDAVVLLAAADDDRVITLMLLDGEVQLAFIQILSTGVIEPL